MAADKHLYECSSSLIIFTPYYAVVTREIKLFLNNFEIILMFYFTCNHV